MNNFLLFYSMHEDEVSGIRVLQGLFFGRSVFESLSRSRANSFTCSGNDGILGHRY